MLQVATARRLQLFVVLVLETLVRLLLVAVCGCVVVVVVVVVVAGCRVGGRVAGEGGVARSEPKARRLEAVGALGAGGVVGRDAEAVGLVLAQVGEHVLALAGRYALLDRQPLGLGHIRHLVLDLEVGERLRLRPTPAQLDLIGRYLRDEWPRDHQ